MDQQVNNTDGKAAKEVAELTRRTRAEGVSDSWKNPEVAQARKQRNSVMVNGVLYRSVTAAFDALDLPMNRHIAFRAKLKKEGVKTFEQGEGLPSYEFTIAPPIKVEKKAKVKKEKPAEAAVAEVAAEETTAVE